MAALERMDILKSCDWAPEERTGAMSKVATQPKASSALANQLVPATIADVSAHVRLALEAEHPASTRRYQSADKGTDKHYGKLLDAELNATARVAAEFGVNANAAVSGREETRAGLSGRLRRLSALARQIFAPPHIRETPLPHTHNAFVAACIEALGLEDRDLPVRMLLGCPVAGDLPPTRAWDRGYVPRPLGLDYDDLPHAQWNRWLARDAERRYSRASAADKRDYDAVWNKCLDEREKDLCEGPFELDDVDEAFGCEFWRAARRFPVWQKGSLRAVDDDAENLGNAASTQRDKLRTQRPDFPARMGAKLASRLPARRRPWSMHGGADDIGSAYRKVLVATRSYTAVIVVDPETGRAMVFILWGFNFGKVAAVIYFNAVPGFAAHVARRILGIMTDHYFDDFSVVRLSMIDGVALRDSEEPQEALGELMIDIGYGFADSKHVAGAPLTTFGGVETDFTRLALEHIIAVRLSDDRKAAIAEQADSALSTCSKEDAASLAGKIWWATEWSAGAAVRAATQPIQERANQDGQYRVTETLREALEFVRDLIPHMPPITLDLDQTDRPPLIVYSDAMYDPTATVEDGGGWVIFDRQSWGGGITVYVALGGTPRAVRERLLKRKTYIGQLELVWAVSPMRTVPAVFRNRQSINFVDNTGAIAGLVKGYSGKLDSAKIVMASSATVIGLGCRNWYAYVNTKANIADLPSRFGMADLMAALHEIDNVVDIIFVEPVMPAIGTWRDAARPWLEAAEIAREPEESLHWLRGKWRHMVRTVPSGGGVPPGCVYVGRNTHLGQTRFGNYAAKIVKARRTARGLRAEHERCVRDFAIWLGAPEQLEHRRMVRRRLRGRGLACHCGDGLPCHGEVLAALANDYSATKAAIQELRRSSLG